MTGKTMCDSPVPTLQESWDRSLKWRGTLRFLPQHEMRPSCIIPHPVVSRVAPPNSTESMTSQRHHVKLPEVTSTSREKPGFPAATGDRPWESFFNASWGPMPLPCSKCQDHDKIHQYDWLWPFNHEDSDVHHFCQAPFKSQCTFLHIILPYYSSLKSSTNKAPAWYGRDYISFDTYLIIMSWVPQLTTIKHRERVRINFCCFNTLNLGGTVWYCSIYLANSLN